MDYGATPEEIQGHFAACGQINRVTILCDKFTGHPKGCVISPSLPSLFPLPGTPFPPPEGSYLTDYLLLVCWDVLVGFRFAYVEFAEPGFVTNATVLDDSVFRGRIIKVGTPPVDLLSSPSLPLLSPLLSLFVPSLQRRPA